MASPLNFGNPIVSRNNSLQNASQIIQQAMMPVLAYIQRKYDMANAQKADRNRQTSALIDQLSGNASDVIMKMGEDRRKKKDEAYMQDFLNVLTTPEDPNTRPESDAPKTPDDKMAHTVSLLDQKYGDTPFGRNVKSMLIQKKLGKMINPSEFDLMSPEQRQAYLDRKANGITKPPTVTDFDRMTPDQQQAYLNHKAGIKPEKGVDPLDAEYKRSRIAVNQSTALKNQGQVLTQAAKAATSPFIAFWNALGGGDPKGKPAASEYTQKPWSESPDVPEDVRQAYRPNKSPKTATAKTEKSISDLQKRITVLQKSLDGYNKEMELYRERDPWYGSPRIEYNLGDKWDTATDNQIKRYNVLKNNIDKIEKNIAELQEQMGRTGDVKVVDSTQSPPQQSIGPEDRYYQSLSAEDKEFVDSYSGEKRNQAIRLLMKQDGVSY